MEGNFDHLIQYNDDDTVNLLKNICLKCQTRRRTPELINEGFISLNHVEGAVDFIEWSEKYVKQIEAGEIKDKSCWSWIMFCSGEGNSC
ncbi:hypothetical protein C1646_761566 [Rhizophagus diaphanus]|nr:hypothetical protein C1646_761566 [Rhizophagus diaphanus] [Rhizophagus sp. MUCL 43196]